MKIAKTASMILGVLFLLLSALPAHSQQPDWDELTADAKAAGQQGNYSQAAALYKQALEIQEETLGPDDPEVATSLNNLAVVYQDERKDAEAEPLYNRALAIWKDTGQLESPEALTTITSLGDIYRSQGKYGEAAPLYEQALAIWKEAG